MSPSSDSTGANPQCSKVQIGADTIEKKWNDCLSDLGISDAVLIWECHYGVGRRTYMAKNRIYKILLKSLPPTSQIPYGDLRNEFEILDYCKLVPCVPEGINFFETDNFQCAQYRLIDGIHLSDPSVTIIRKISSVLAVAWLLFRLSLRGVAHNDVSLKNILIDGSRTFLIDFDCAKRTSRFDAFYRNFISWPDHARRFHGGLNKLLKMCLQSIYRK